MLRPGMNLRVQIALNLDPDQNGNQDTQSIQTPQVELSDPEKEMKLNQIINDIQRGNITVDEATPALEEVGIIPEVTTQGNKTVSTFEFKGKKYTVNLNKTIARSRSVLLQNKGVQSLLIGTSNDAEMVSWLALGQHVSVIGVGGHTLVKNDTYTLDELKNTYKLTDQDINTFFEKQDNNYKIKQSATKSCFGREDITTVSQLLDAMKNDGFSENYVRGAYNFSQKQADKYLTLINQNPKKYILNQDAIKADFPEQEINTLGQLKEAIANGVTSTTVSVTDAEKDCITAFSENELRGRYGFSTLALLMFFTKLENGTYIMNMDAINDFWGGYNRDTIDKLDNFNDTYGMGSSRKEKVYQFVKDALKSGELTIGLEDETPLTDDEIEFICEQLRLLDTSTSNVTFTQLSQIITNNLSTIKIKNQIELQRFETKFDANEFNKCASQDETLDYITKYLNLLKTNLKQKYNYSDDYINKLLSFVQQDLLGEKNEYNINDVLRQLKENIIQIISPPDMHAYSSQAGYDLLSEEIYAVNMPFIIKILSNSNNIQERFFISLFIDKIQEMNLNFSDDEQMTFFNILLQKLGAQKSCSGVYSLSIEDLIKLNKNGDASWFDEVFKIAKEEFAKIKHMDQNEINNAQIINSSALLNNKNSITADDIIDNFNILKLSNDAGTRKLMQMLEDAFDKFECFWDIDKKDLIKHIICFINQKCGITNSNPPTLTKDAIEKLNKSDIFNEIQNIIDSNELYIAFMVNVDGVIDDFRQGSTGDCWLLTAIKALSSSPGGQQIIKNQIQWADDYSSVTIYFAGLHRYVTVTAEEIIEAKAAGNLSQGDEDVLVLELAMQKVYGDINGDQANTFWSRFIGNANIETDRKVNGDSQKLRKWLKNLLQKKQQGKNFAASFSLKSKGGASCSCTCIDGSKFSYSSGAHAFAITDITPTTVTFVNPWDSSTEYEVSWNEFISLGAFATDTVYF